MHRVNTISEITTKYIDSSMSNVIIFIGRTQNNYIVYMLQCMHKNQDKSAYSLS